MKQLIPGINSPFEKHLILYPNQICFSQGIFSSEYHRPVTGVGSLSTLSILCDKIGKKEKRNEYQLQSIFITTQPNLLTFSSSLMFHMLFCVIFTDGQPKINIAILINTRCRENKTIFFLSPTSITKVDCLYSRSIANKTKWCKREMRKKWGKITKRWKGKGRGKEQTDQK